MSHYADSLNDIYYAVKDAQDRVDGYFNDMLAVLSRTNRSGSTKLDAMESEEAVGEADAVLGEVQSDLYSCISAALGAQAALARLT